jgi:catechol 2,3-dioxygenase-like lactoylglutathione lyase family enzyme
MSVQGMRVHVSLNVADVTKSIEFYKRMFNLEPVRVRPGYAKFDVPQAGLNLALNETGKPRNDSAKEGALSHLGIQVASTEEVLAVRKQWIERELITRDEMQTNCCYAKQDKTWVNDPDGNEWEVFVVLGEVAKNEASTTCCVA